MPDFALDSLRPSGRNARTVFDPERLQELADTIREHGVLEPLVVTKSARLGDRWIIVAGERRFRAAKLAGLKTVPVVIQERLRDSQIVELMLLENIQREDLPPLDLARSYASLIEEFGFTREKVATRIRKSVGHVSQMLGLLELPGDVQSRLRVREISVSHAVALLPLATDPERCSRAAAAIAGGALTVGEANELVCRYRNRTTSGGGTRTYGKAAAALREALQDAVDRGRTDLAPLLDHRGPALIDALAEHLRRDLTPGD